MSAKQRLCSPIVAIIIWRCVLCPWSLALSFCAEDSEGMIEVTTTGSMTGHLLLALFDTNRKEWQNNNSYSYFFFTVGSFKSVRLLQVCALCLPAVTHPYSQCGLSRSKIKIQYSIPVPMQKNNVYKFGSVFCILNVEKHDALCIVWNNWIWVLFEWRVVIGKILKQNLEQ